MRRLSALTIGLVWFLAVSAAHAAVRTKAVEYRHGETVLEGYLAYDDALEGARPGVLVVHEWKGLNDYAKRRAEQLASLGYIAFAADMYGQGVQAQDHTEAARLSGIYRSDRHLMRARATAALDVLRQHPLSDPERLAAIGYCFGGTTVLELARGGADLRAVASFHGGLATPHPEDARNIRGRVVVFHGAEDQFVTDDEVVAFEREMDEAGVDYEVVAYQGAVHSFTVPEAGSDPSAGMAHHPEADRQSWEALQVLLREVFGESGG